MNNRLTQGSELLVIQEAGIGSINSSTFYNYKETDTITFDQLFIHPIF